MRWLYAIAAASFLPALAFYYVGEEAIFPITSLEMWQSGDWVRQRLFGGNVQHNPLFNWLIIALASLTGWEHVLAVARAITIAATVGTGLVLAWLCRVLYRDRAFAAFAGLVYLTFIDIFFYRGWLAYADPLFAFFVFSAIACLWAACERRGVALLAVGAGSLVCALMTKALTGYVFYGAAALVLLAARRQYRAFLLGPASWAFHVASLVLPLAWLYLLPENAGQGGRMLAEIVDKLGYRGVGAYAVKLVAFPLETLARLAPAALIAAYFVWRRGAAVVEPADTHRRLAFWIVLINFLPYWLAPQSAIRYLMPLYPLAGLVVARVLWRAGAQAVALAQRWLVGLIVLKFVFVLAGFPAYQHWYRGQNYETAARDILAHTAGHPLYTTNVAASGLSVAAHIDILRLPAAPLTFPPADWESGFVIAYAPDAKLGQVARKYRLGGNDLFLVCRGSACGAPAQASPPGR
ncbi:MAG: dolichyl-phosphate-mannose--protein mannosyltransferase [Burkholderiales bacterium]|nr:dolichyl-phosphate-mannose--protein mannosyltransferase [Burkholderiales bacterium]